ncbi:hypothetical protein EMIT0357P_50165 [Pseudomonas marginalis]
MCSTALRAERRKPIQCASELKTLIQDLKKLDGAGFQGFPPERKKDPKVLISIACRIQWNSAAQYLERETRLVSGVRLVEI